MKYMGSKNRISKYIIPIILKNRKPEQYYVEPFCGGCNSLDKVSNPRIGNDINPYLIEFLKYIQIHIPFSPRHFSEDEYKQVQNNKHNYHPAIVGYVGFNLSFGAKFFGGYRRDKKGIRNYENEAQQNIRAQQKNLTGIEFYCGEYDKLPIPENSIIYCDLPYRATTKYSSNFDYDKFYSWCAEKKNQGHQIFIFEYDMPKEFVCIWEREIHSNLTVDTKGKRETEKLFIIK